MKREIKDEVIKELNKKIKEISKVNLNLILKEENLHFLNYYDGDYYSDKEKLALLQNKATQSAEEEKEIDRIKNKINNTIDNYLAEERKIEGDIKANEKLKIDYLTALYVVGGL